MTKAARRLLLAIGGLLVCFVVVRNVFSVRFFLLDVFQSHSSSTMEQQRAVVFEVLQNSSNNHNNNNNDDDHQRDNNPIHLIQVLSPFAPLDLNQKITFQSLERARLYLNSTQIQLDLVCVVLESDREALAHLPCRQVFLNRSTQTEYPFAKKALPFLQDILEASTAYQKDDGEDFYWMYTNADIGLTRHFYSAVYDKLKGGGRRRDAISINRVTIPMENITNTDDDDTILSQVDALLDFGPHHPGHDCFIIHSLTLKRIHFGDFFVGHPPWGGNVRFMLQIMSDHYEMLSSAYQLTFHLGNERSWYVESPKTALGRRKSGNDQFDLVLLQRVHADLIQQCPKNKDHIKSQYHLENVLNCGRWFSPNRIVHNVSIPTFVQPGYEPMYIKRYKNFVISDDGLFSGNNNNNNNKTALEKRKILNQYRASRQKQRGAGLGIQDHPVFHHNNNNNIRLVGGGRRGGSLRQKLKKKAKTRATK